MVTKAEVAPPVERQIVPISPKSVTIDHVTHTRKHVIVELDPGLTLQDLNDHADKIWRLVQRDRTKHLAANDVVEIRSIDWTAFAVVNSISSDGVFLYDIRRASRPQRTVELFQDEQFRIAQVGTRFAVYRKAHNDPNPFGGQTYETAEQAKQFIMTQYSRKVG